MIKLQRAGPLNIVVKLDCNEPRDLQLLRLHLPIAGKGMLRIVGELLHPIAQLRRVDL